MHEGKMFGPLLRYISHLARERMEARLAQYDVTPVQTHVLLYLHRIGGSAPQGELAEYLKVKPSTANGILDRMVEKSLVTRTADDSDARRRLITVTELGRSKQAQFEKTAAETEEMLTQGLSQAEMDQLRTLLARVIKNLEEDRTI